MKTKVRDLDKVDRLREARSFHGADVELRRRGYKIYSRPKYGPVLWVRDGEVFVQANDGSILLERKQ